MQFEKTLLLGLFLFGESSCFAIGGATTLSRVVKTIVGIPLVSGVMTYVQTTPMTKENVAYHEASHNVVQSVLENDSCSIKETRIHPYGYWWHGHVKLQDSFNDNRENHIKFCLGGMAGIQQNQRLKVQQNFMEQELNLPLSRLSDCVEDVPTWTFCAPSMSDMAKSFKHTEILALNDYYESHKDLLYSNPEEFYTMVRAKTHEKVPEFYKKTLDLVKEYEPEIRVVAEELLKKEYLSGDESNKLIKDSLSRRGKSL